MRTITRLFCFGSQKQRASSKYVVHTKDILFGSYDRAIMWPKETKPNWYIEISDNLKPFFLDGDAQCNGAKDESMGSESVSEIADFFLS